MELNDIELVAMVKAGDERRAFTTLVRRHQAKLRAFLVRLSGNAAQADDLAQSTFMKAHASMAAFSGGGSFRSWLYAIAYREFLQDARKAKAAARLQATLETGADEHSQPSTEPGLSLDLRRALERLDDMERGAILLCDAAGLSHSEAATALDAPLGSIKTYVARAREKMRALLSAEPAHPDRQNATQPIEGPCHAC